MVLGTSDRRAGFTLIEISIVLVIIGLIVGSILVGRDLIKAAQMRKTITTITELNTATQAFRNKYNCLPGDCAHATTFFTGAAEPALVYNGNGDGALASTIFNAPLETTAVYTNSERANYFDHLAAASLVNMQQFDVTSQAILDNGTGYLKTSVGNGILPFAGFSDQTCTTDGVDRYDYAKGGHFFLLGFTADISTGPNGAIATSPSTLPPDVAMSIDTKLDDGNPTTGKVIDVYQQASTSNLFATCDTPNAPGHCIYRPTGVETYPNWYYNLTSTGEYCSISIKATF